MKNMKWFCRYAFLTLLLVLCIGFCVYCGVTISALEKQTQSIGFLDLALGSLSQAHQVLDQITYYEQLLRGGIIVGVIVAVALGLLITWHVMGDKWLASLAQKKATKKVKPAPTAAPIPAPAPKAAYFCPHCGARHEEKPAFCGDCGQKID